MAGEFQPQLTQPQAIAQSTTKGGSPVVAGLGVLVDAAGSIFKEGQAQRRVAATTKRTNETLDILLNPLTAEGDIPANDPEIAKIVAADTLAKQTGNVTKATAALGVGVKRLIASGRTELEIQAALKTKGIADPRIAALEEIQAAEDEVEDTQNRLIDQQVSEAGLQYQLNNNGKPIALFGGTYNREKSSRKLRQDEVALEQHTEDAKNNFARLVDTGLDPKQPNSITSIIRDSLGPLSDALNDEVGKDIRNINSILQIQQMGQGIISNLREQQGLLLSQIPDKDNRKDFQERTDSLIKAYEDQFFADSGDHATLSRVGTANTFIATVDKANFRRDVPALAIAGNVSQPLQEFMLQTPMFQNLAKAANTTVSRQFGAWIDGAIGFAPGLATTPGEPTPTATPPARVVVTEDAAITGANLLSNQAKITVGNATQEAISRQDESLTNPIDGNLSGNGPSMLEVNARMVLDPDATANFSLKDDQEVVHKTWAIPRIAGQVDLLERKAPGKGKALGAAVHSKVSSVALRTAVELGKIPGFLEVFVLEIDPATQRFKMFTPETRAAELTPFLGLQSRNTGIFNIARDSAQMLNEQVDTLMLYGKYDDRLSTLSDTQRRKFYQDALLSVAASQELGVTEDIIVLFPQEDEKQEIE